MKNVVLEFPYFCPRCGTHIKNISIDAAAIDITCETCGTFSVPKAEFIKRLEKALPALERAHRNEITAMRRLIAQLKKR